MKFKIDNGVLKKFTMEDGDSKNIVIPEGVECIESFAFKNCRNIESVVIPQGVTEIEKGVFVNCTNLREVNIPDSVTNIGTSAFKSCRSLEKVVLPDSVTEIGMGVFCGCKSLKSAVLPKNIKAIPHSLFYKCESLENITIPDGVADIDEVAFSFCTSLTEITIPDSVLRMDDMIFCGCTSLKTIKNSANLQSLGINAFEDTEWLKNQKKGTLIVGKVFYRYTGDEKEVEIPGYINSVSSNAFYKCENLTGVKIPDGIRFIDDDAFRDCINLEKADIPESVVFIGDGAFMSCSKLSEVVICGDTEIFDDAFRNCPNLRKITFMKEIDADINCSALDETPWFKEQEKGFIMVGTTLYGYKGNEEEITIPDGVTMVVSKAFRNCRKLRKLTIPGTVKLIGNNIFLDSPDFETIKIENIAEIKRSEIKKVIGNQGKAETEEKSALCINKIAEMLINRDFAEADEEADYIYLIDCFLSTHNDFAGLCIKSGLNCAMSGVIKAENIERLNRIISDTDFITAQNIDEFIQCAIENAKPELYITLVNYKEKAFGMNSDLEL